MFSVDVPQATSCSSTPVYDAFNGPIWSKALPQMVHDGVDGRVMRGKGYRSKRGTITFSMSSSCFTSFVPDVVCSVPLRRLFRIIR